tara:strand:+ start:7872 stop:8285 length:414 start_codon:yes stop_codon:yes gene_type:complete
MKIVDSAVRKGFRDLPREQRKHIGDAIRKSSLEGLRWMRTLAPSDTGELKAEMHVKFEASDTGIIASVEAAKVDKASQIKANTLEGGRKYREGVKTPFRGRSEGYYFVNRSRSLLGPKHASRISRAMVKAMKGAGWK